jgi:hypothetical protein
MNTQEQTFIIDDLLNELQTAVKSQLQAAGKPDIDVWLFKYKKDHTCRILADREQIRQAFVHLLDNSVKFTDSGFISFGYYVLMPDLVDFFVTDTGTRMFLDNPDQYLTAVRDLLQQTGIRLKERKPNDISAKYSFSVKCEPVELTKIA